MVYMYAEATMYDVSVCGRVDIKLAVRVFAWCMFAYVVMNQLACHCSTCLPDPWGGEDNTVRR